jgi:hypothetical protein
LRVAFVGTQGVRERAQEFAPFSAVTSNARLEAAKCAQHSQRFARRVDHQVFTASQRVEAEALEAVECACRRVTRLVHPGEFLGNVNPGFVVEEEAYEFEPLDFPRAGRLWDLLESVRYDASDVEAVLDITEA